MRTPEGLDLEARMEAGFSDSIEFEGRQGLM